MGKSIEVAKIDPTTGNPIRDDAGELVKHRVDPKTGAPVTPKKASSSKSSGSKKKRKEKGGS